MRTLAHPARKDIELTSVFRALSDPVRLGIVTGLLHGGEQSTGGLAVPMNKSSLSHHLKILREAGVTFTRIQGTRRLLSLRREDLEARFPGLLAAVTAAGHPASAHASAPIGRCAA